MDWTPAQTKMHGYGDASMHAWAQRQRQRARRLRCASIASAVGALAAIVVAVIAPLPLTFPLLGVAAMLLVAMHHWHHTVASLQRNAQAVEDRLTAIRQMERLLSVGRQKYGWRPLRDRPLSFHAPDFIVFSADRRNVAIIGVAPDRSPAASATIRRARARVRTVARSLQSYLRRAHRPCAAPRVHALIALPLADDCIFYDGEDSDGGDIIAAVGGEARLLAEIERALNSALSLDAQR